jgi:hypothetical protein
MAKFVHLPVYIQKIIWLMVVLNGVKFHALIVVFTFTGVKK